jgi:hypothetical protein
MKAILLRYLSILPLIAFLMIAMQLSITWVFVRFVHYHSQYQTLPAASYQVELITAEDYARLQDPTLNEVKLSNGATIIDRQPSWYEIVLPNYKKLGDGYIRVTTLGTAHYYYRWMTDALPILGLTAWGLFVSQWDLRRRLSIAADNPNPNRP